MKIHFGKQWRQLEKCIIQCQETAQGSKPEPQPGTDWSVSTISCWKWVGEERACSPFLPTATIFHTTTDFGDIYFQNHSSTPSAELCLSQFSSFTTRRNVDTGPQQTISKQWIETMCKSGDRDMHFWRTNTIYSELFQPSTVVRQRLGSSHMLKNYSAWILICPESCSSLDCQL